MLPEPRNLRCRDLRDAHIGEAYWDVVLDEIDVQVFRTAALRYVDALESARKNGYGLYLSGSNGLGKTHTMSAILKVALEHRYSALLVTPAEIKSIKAGDIVSMQQIGAPNMLTEVDFLGIDDFCKEQYKSSGDRSMFYERVIEEVLRNRLQNKLPTLVTSNSELDSVNSYYGDSVQSLLLGSVVEVHLAEGADLRRERQHAKVNDWWNTGR